MAEELCKIWRVLNERTGGPYRNEKMFYILQEICPNKQEDHPIDRCPGPLNDKDLSKIFKDAASLDKAGPLYYGFKDISQYQNWFKPDKLKNALDENGYFLCQLELPKANIFFGDKQVAFTVNMNNLKIVNSAAVYKATQIFRLMKSNNMTRCSNS